MIKNYTGLFVPAIVAYFMFYRRFAKFWKKKDLLSVHPILFYAPILGLTVIFSWWFVSSMMQVFFSGTRGNLGAPSIDGMLGFLFKEVPPVLREAFFPATQMKPNQLNPARAVVVELSTKIYMLLLPYCAFLIGISSLPSRP